MPILLIFILTAACLPVRMPYPLIGDGRDAPLVFTVTSLLMAIGAAFGLRTWVVATLQRTPQRRIEVGRVYGRLRRRLFFVNLGVVLVCVLVFGWGWFVQKDGRPPGPFAELLVPLPYFILLFASWIIYYDAERALHRTTILGPSRQDFWTRPGYFLHNLRQFALMVMLPVLLFVTQQTAVEFFPNVVQTDEYRLGSIGVLALVFLLMPLAIKPILGLRTLPSGPIRDRLEAVARRLHFKCTDFLLWPTHGTAVNAMIVGLLPRVRYVIFTDRILEDLPPDELDAVFGHEVGHAKHGHIAYYGFFLILSIITLAAAFLLFLQSLSAAGVELPAWMDEEWLLVVPLVMAAMYVFVVWGFLSRRCERQADVYGCRTVSCSDPACMGHDAATQYPERARGLCPTGIRTFIAALERVDTVNVYIGVEEIRTSALRTFIREFSKWLRAWQHAPISRRIDFLRSLILDPRKERTFQRSVAILRWGLIVGLAWALFGLGQAVGWAELYRAAF